MATLNDTLSTEILETVRLPLLALDPDLRVQTANDAFLSHFRVARENTIGHLLYDLGNGQWDIPELRLLLGEILPEKRTVTNYRVEHDFETIGRRIMHVSARRIARADDPDLILIAISDDTEQEALRAELEGRVELSDKLIDIVREGLLILDPDLRVHSASGAFYETFCVKPEETVGHLVYELGNGQWDIPELRRLLEEILPRQQSFDDFEVTHTFDDIGERVMVLNGRRLDHKDLILLAIRDVTEHRQSEMRFRRIAEANLIGVAFCSREGDVSYANDEMLRMMGRTRAEFEAGKITCSESIAPEDREEMQRSLNILAKAGAVTGYERNFLRPDGTRTPFIGAAAQTSPFGDMHVSLALDLTERKHAEEHQNMLMAELDHRVKNILAVVQSIARQSLGRGPDAGADAAERLVGRIGALARSHALLASSRWEGAEFRDVIESAVAPYRGEKAERFVAEGPDLKVTPKAAQTLNLAFHELVTNAAKYGALSRSGGHVRAEWNIEGEAGNQQLCFTWRETGGPPIEEAPGRNGFGSKLIVQTLRFELGGEVDLDYAQDGLRARIVLPLNVLRVENGSGGSRGRQTDQVDGAPSSLRGKRVLVIEDEFLIGEETAGVLRSAGCAVTGPIGTLQEALQLAVSEDFDGAVLDIRLGGNLVWPAARALKAREIPLVFATGYSDTVEPPSDLRDMRRIEKPMEAKHLLAGLSACMAA